MIEKQLANKLEAEKQQCLLERLDFGHRMRLKGMFPERVKNVENILRFLAVVYSTLASFKEEITP